MMVSWHEFNTSRPVTLSLRLAGGGAEIVAEDRDTAVVDVAPDDNSDASREADLVVTESAPQPTPAAPPPAAPEGADLARITLRLPEPLKEQIERAASAEGVSVNAWLVRAISAAVYTPPPIPNSERMRPGRRITGFAQA